MIDVKIYKDGRLIEHVFAGQKEEKEGHTRHTAVFGEEGGEGNSRGVGRFVYHSSVECMARLGERMLRAVADFRENKQEENEEIELDDIEASLEMHPIPWELIESIDTNHIVEIVDADGWTVVYGHTEDCIPLYKSIVEAVNAYGEKKENV